jgi:tetratricopeptide (TPR) repeat protein
MRDSVWRKWTAALCVVTAVAAQAPLASADEADGIITKGTELRRQGRDAEALAEFQKAARMRKSARATAQIALAEQALGLWVDANQHLGQALEEGHDPWIKKNRKTLESALSTIQGHLCRIEVWGAPSGAEVSIDGKRVGTLPNVTTWAAPGDVLFEVKAEGYTGMQRAMKTGEGGRIREHVELRRAAVEPVAKEERAPRVPKLEASLAATQEAEPATLVAKPAEATPITDPAEGSAQHRWWLWTLVGVGVIAGGATTAWFLTHRGQTCDRPPCSTWN